MSDTARTHDGHGWWPYLLPEMSFLLLIELGRRLPDEPGVALAMLALKPLVPLALIAFFWSRGGYPELRASTLNPSGLFLDLAFGAFTGFLWMAPYVVLPMLRPGPDAAFDPNQAGPELATAVIGLRLFGYAVATPMFEELFIRSFVMRVAEVWDTPRDFREVPIGHYARRGFFVSAVVFVMTHIGWEWPSAVVWIVLTNLWFFWRRNLWSLIAVHAAANASILLAALALEGVLPDGQGGRLSLWFFV